MGQYSFTREDRLLIPAHFNHVFANAIPAASKHLTLLARHNQLNHPRVGITIAKNRVRMAHDRNRIKRLIRESFRHNKHQLGNIDIIVIGKSGLDALSNSDIKQLLDSSWRRLVKKSQTASM